MDYYKNFRDKRTGIKSKMVFHERVYPHRTTPERIRFLKQLGINDVSICFDPQNLNFDEILRTADMVRGWGFRITDADCGVGPKSNSALLYGGEGEKEFLDIYEMFTRAAGSADIPIVNLTWHACVARTGNIKTERSPYAACGVFDKEEFDRINAPIEHDREEVWDAFTRFCDRIMPACEEAGVKVALHPCDPPCGGYRGIATLIQSSNDYRRAFKMAGPNLGMKLCVGCWLEGGDAFGDLLADIEEFIKDGRVHEVHFRNVFGSLSQKPFRFEETRLDNGAMDMYLVMKQLVKCGYTGSICPDHVQVWEEEFGGANSSLAWAFGYIEALMHCAEQALSFSGETCGI